MGRTAVAGCVVALGLLGSCRSTKPEVVAEKVTVRYCATSVTAHKVLRCVAEITPEQQRRRERTVRLTYRGDVLQRREVVSGAGELFDEDVENYEYASGRLVAASKTSRTGVAVGRETYSPDGLVTHNFDERGRPKPYRRWDVGAIRWQVDAAGFLQAGVYLDVDGKPAPTNGVSEWRVKRNAQGVPLEVSYFGPNGEPVKGPDGAHREVSEVDALGLVHRQTCFDEQGQPALCQGAHELLMRYDDAGNCVQLAFFDVNARPARDESWGAARVEFTRDARGNHIATQLFDEQGKVTLGKEGFASRKVSFDARDRPIEYNDLGLDGAPIKRRGDGAATARLSYDARGRRTTVLLFDEAGARMLSSTGYFRVDTEWDARDNPIVTRYSDVNEQPVLIKPGYAIERHTYDGDRVATYSLFDAAGKPVLGSGGYARSELSYDANGKAKKWRSFDLDGKEVSSPTADEGCHGSVGDALKKELQARRSELRGCFQALLKTSPKAKGKVVANLTIDAQGKVLSAKISDDQVESPSFTECLLAKLRQPCANGVQRGCATIRFPMTFTNP